ncbi:MAG: hypothetical protein ACXV95_12395 [Acidimicrobiales bacterium]
MTGSDLQAQPGPEPTSRRAFIARTTVGLAAAGVVWAAPSILTVDAAAAGSCGVAVSTLDWSLVTTGAPGPSSVSGQTNMHGVTATISHTDPNGRAFTDSFQALTLASAGARFGNATQWYELQMSGASVGDLQTATFAFNNALNSLSFTLLDIDQNNNNQTGRWRDIVSVAATGATGSAVGFTTSAMGANVTGSGTTATPFSATGSNVGNTSTAGNVTLSFTAPVKSFVITYNAAAPTGSTQTTGFDEQRIGITNLTWTGCT